MQACLTAGTLEASSGLQDALEISAALERHILAQQRTATHPAVTDPGCQKFWVFVLQERAAVLEETVEQLMTDLDSSMQDVVDRDEEIDSLEAKLAGIQVE